MSTQDYRIENGLVVNGPITADNVPGSVSDLTDVDLGETGPSDGDTLLWSSDTSKWEPGAGSGASYWTLQAGESPNPDLIYTQYNVGIGTFGDQSSDYRLVVNGGTQLDDLKVVNNSLIGDGAGSGVDSYLGEINLVPNVDLVGQGQYIKLRPTANPTDQSHIHIEAGDVDSADLFLGNDDRYVKIDHTGPVKIGVPAATTTSSWVAPGSGSTAYLTLELVTYPWAVSLSFDDFITLPDTTTFNITNLSFDATNAYVTLSSIITYAEADIIEFTYQPRSEWSFNPDSSAEFPGDLTATSFIGDGSELTGIELAGLADVDTTTSPPSTGQGLLWDGLTSKWRPGNVPQGEPGADALWNFTGAYNAGLPYAVGDVATYNGETWYRIDAHGGNLGDTPSEGTFWTKLAAKGADGGGGGGGSLSYTTLSYTTPLLAAGATDDITLAGGDVFNLLAITSSNPVWVRVYGTTEARSADTRTQPGGIPPGSGNDYYAELVTVATPQTIRFSPVPVVQGTTGNAYVRVKNVDSSARTITIDFTILTLILES
jgi:hypothetical protein